MCKTSTTSPTVKQCLVLDQYDNTRNNQPAYEEGEKAVLGTKLAQSLECKNDTFVLCVTLQMQRMLTDACMKDCIELDVD